MNGTNENEKIIWLHEFLWLLNGQVSDQYNDDESDPYFVNSSGVRAKERTHQGVKLLFIEELRTLSELENLVAKLDFPCSIKEFQGWCNGNHIPVDPDRLEEFKSQAQVSEMNPDCGSNVEIILSDCGDITL